MTRRILVADNLELLPEKKEWDIWARNRVDYVTKPHLLSGYMPSLREGKYSLMIFDPIALFSEVGGFESKKDLVTRILAQVHQSTSIVYTLDRGQETKVAGLRGSDGIITKPYFVKPLVDRF